MALGGIAAEQEAWAEIRALITSINSTVGTDVSRLKMARDYIANKDFVILLNQVQRVILENVPEQARRVKIKQGFNAILNGEYQ